ncbi:hypothetical protein VNO78_26768 [Psophocarpus tetragonolobus]|uniref:Uncharacterized protein n=1 Tax=Psophocarpus tetragonolobus TaxID=3891 RepID=A0AAN9S034_PSOTE
MGNCFCNSYETTCLSTAKLVVHDGRLHEFSYPVKVSYLLQLYPSCFICDSDEMAFDDVVTPVHQDDELKPGQLYFALPLSRLKRLIPPQEMAALAVVASSALAKCASPLQQIVIFSSDGNAKSARRVTPAAAATLDSATSNKGKPKTGVRGRGKFTATLSSIPEQG